MDAKAFLAEARQRNENLLSRGLAAVAGLDDAELNTAMEGGWSPAQILDHMVVSNKGYESHLALAGAQAKSSDGGVPRTWFGKTLQRMAGPDKDVAVPKAFIPGDGPFTREVVSSWEQSQRGILRAIDQFAGRDLGFRIRNPVVRLFPMTVADAIAVLTDHTERHVRQLETRIPKMIAGVTGTPASRS